MGCSSPTASPNSATADCVTRHANSITEPTSGEPSCGAVSPSFMASPADSLAPLDLGFALLGKTRKAGPRIAGPGDARQGLRLQLKLRLQGLMFRRDQQPPYFAEGARGARRELQSDAVRPCLDLRSRHHLVDETGRQCLGRPPTFVQPQLLARARFVHSPGQHD